MYFIDQPVPGLIPVPTFSDLVTSEALFSISCLGLWVHKALPHFGHDCFSATWCNTYFKIKTYCRAALLQWVTSDHTTPLLLEVISWYFQNELTCNLDPFYYRFILIKVFYSPIVCGFIVSTRSFNIHFGFCIHHKYLNNPLPKYNSDPIQPSLWGMLQLLKTLYLFKFHMNRDGWIVRTEHKFDQNFVCLTDLRTSKFAGSSAGCSPTKHHTMHCMLHIAF